MASLDERYYTTAEAAELLRTTPRTMSLRARRGLIRASRVGGQWLFAASDIARYLDAGQNHAITRTRRRRRRRVT